MAPLIMLVGTFVVARGLGALGVIRFRSWTFCLRVALAAMFLLTASAHFGSRRPDLVQMVPSAFPNPELIVTLTGIAELLGAVGLLIPRLTPWAASALTLLLVAMFPANIRAAREGLTIGGAAATPLVPRTVLQIVFIAALLAAGFWRSSGERPDAPRREGLRA